MLMGMDIPLPAIRQQISSAIDIIVHLGRLRDRSRKVLEICEVGNVVEGEIEVFPIFTFCELGEEEGRILGTLERTGHVLCSMDKCRRAGVNLSYLIYSLYLFTSGENPLWSSGNCPWRNHWNAVF